MSIDIKICTPSKTKVIKNISEIILPSISGELGILENHSPLLTALDIGVLRIKNEEKWIYLAIFDGIASIKNNELVLVLRGIEELEDLKITLDQARAELSEASDNFSLAETKKEKFLALVNLKKSIVRFQVLSLSNL